MKREISIGILVGFLLAIVVGWFFMWPDLHFWAKSLGTGVLLKTWGICSLITFALTTLLIGLEAIMKHSDVNAIKALKALEMKQIIVAAAISVIASPPFIIYYPTILALHSH